MPEVEIKSIGKLSALLLLSDKGQYGYEIMKEMEGRLGRKASPGQIYPFLKELEKHHYLKSKGRAERDKKVYYITPQGKRFVDAVSNRMNNIFDMALKNKLTVCAHCKCEVYEGAYREKVGSRYLDFCCKSCAESYKVMKASR